MPRKIPGSDVIGQKLVEATDKALAVSRPAIIANMRSVQKLKPQATPAETIKYLEREFRTVVGASGAVSGGAAAAPGVSTGLGIAASVADAGGFLAVAALHVFSLAEVHGVPAEDLARRKTLFYGVLLGESAQATLQKAAGRTGAHWARKVVAKVPGSSLARVNAILGRNFVTKYGTKQGILVLGKAVPFGIGAAIGASGNAIFAQAVIKSARKAFGPPPSEFPPELQVALKAPEDETLDEDEIIDAEIVEEAQAAAETVEPRE